MMQLDEAKPLVRAAVAEFRKKYQRSPNVWEYLHLLPKDISDGACMALMAGAMEDKMP